ncbi:hypothetical protein SLA2020_044750 [Shorea laevis]
MLAAKKQNVVRGLEIATTAVLRSVARADWIGIFGVSASGIRSSVVGVSGIPNYLFPFFGPCYCKMQITYVANYFVF